MKLSTRARYALRIMLDVAKNGGERAPVSLSGVAQRTGLSRGYLEQLALALKNARVLRGVSGRLGGYRLARPAKDITIGEIIEAAIGPICVVDCIEDTASCPLSDYCECRLLYSLINTGIQDVVHGYTLADLLDANWYRRVEELEHSVETRRRRASRAGGARRAGRPARTEK